MANDSSDKGEKKGRKKKKDSGGMGNSTKVAATVIATATVLSPEVRSVLRQGAVRGLAGVLMLGDALASFARGVGRGIQNGDAAQANSGLSSTSSADQTAGEAVRAAQEAARQAQEAAQAAQEALAAVRKKPTRKRPRVEEGGEDSNG